MAGYYVRSSDNLDDRCRDVILRCRRVGQDSYVEDHHCLVVTPGRQSKVLGGCKVRSVRPVVYGTSHPNAAHV